MELSIIEILILFAGAGGLGIALWSVISRQADNVNVSRKEEKARKASENAAAVEAVNKNKQKEIAKNQKEMQEKVSDAVQGVKTNESGSEVIIDKLVDLWNDKFNRKK